MDAVIKIFLVLCGSISILTGLFLNLRVIVQTVRQKLGMNGIFPFLMATADLLNMAIDSFWLFNKLVPMQVPVIFSVTHLFVFLMGLFISISAFFSYMLLRTLIVVWPIKCRVYLKRRYVYSVAFFNILCTTLLASSGYYIYYDLFFTDMRTLLSEFERRPSPLGYIIIRYIFLIYLFVLFASTILLTVVSCCRLSRKAFSDTDDTIKRKKRAMLTLLMCMIVFVTCQFVYFVVMAIYYGEAKTAGIALSTDGFVFLFGLREVAFNANPLLYYRTRNVTRHKAVHPKAQHSNTSSSAAKSSSVKSDETQHTTKSTAETLGSV
ncbi:hypothetical protein M3Y97_01082800 [Aphelenchoides bicaudatus]|nr:hypothetical protein M3Y97_01082800 [Aphelenchoides bicaudatus]